MSQSRVNIEIFDTTLRDGAQSQPENNQFKPGSKPNIADCIARLGISTIEAGFPATPFDAEEVTEVAKRTGNTPISSDAWSSSSQGPAQSEQKIPRIAGLSRAVPSDIEATWKSIMYAMHPTIHTFISTDPGHMAAKFPGKSPEQVLSMCTSAIKHAIDTSEGKARIEFSAEAASTTDTVFLERVVKGAIQSGADIINVPDTVGRKDPFFMRSFYDRVINWCMDENTDTVVSAHNHNDMGMAVANSIALVFSATDYARRTAQGVSIQLEGTICGIGERAGNADIFPIALALSQWKPEEGNIIYDYNRQRSVESAEYIMAAAGMLVPVQNPVVGADVNAHRSGIHSDGVIKGGHSIYTPFTPTDWGHDVDARHEEGKYQGVSGTAAARLV